MDRHVKGGRGALLNGHTMCTCNPMSGLPNSLDMNRPLGGTAFTAAISWQTMLSKMFPDITFSTN